MFLFSFLTLCLCLQHFHNNFLLLDKESTLDPVTDTFSTHGTTIGPADVFFGFRQSHQDFRSHSTNPTKSAWAHTTCRFWCLPNLLSIKVNNSVTRSSGQSGFVGGCIVGEPLAVRQTLDHCGCVSSKNHPLEVWCPATFGMAVDSKAHRRDHFFRIKKKFTWKLGCERDLPFSCSLTRSGPSWSPEPDTTSGSPTWRRPSTWAITHGLSRHIIRKLYWKWSSWNLN